MLKYYNRMPLGSPSASGFPTLNSDNTLLDFPKKTPIPKSTLDPPQVGRSRQNTKITSQKSETLENEGGIKSVKSDLSQQWIERKGPEGRP